jgi:thymidylate synthase
MNTLDKKYQELLQDILDSGIRKEDRTGTGTISVFGRQIRHKMSEGFPLLTTKKMYWKGIVTELLWFLRGDTNIKYLVDNDCHIWDGDAYKNYLHKVIRDKDIVRYLKSYSVDTNGVPTIEPYSKDEFIERIKNDTEFAEKWGDLGPVYGKQWRSWGTGETVTVGHNGQHTLLGEKVVDQIQNLINDLKTNPDSRRLMVSAWNVGELDSMTLPPCHYGFQVYTRELSWDERHELAETKYQIDDVDDVLDKEGIPTRAISLMYNARSQDVPLGTPFNISSYALLLTIIAKEVNMIPDELIANMGDCHIYLNQIEGVKEQIGREPYPLPKLLCLDEFHYLMDKELVGEIPFSEKIEKFRPDFFTLENYQSHPSIKMPLSN